MGFFAKLFGRDQGIDLDTLLEVVPEHFEERFGPVDMVWHELVSDELHIDVHTIPPNPKCPHNVIFTTGMSMRRMKGEPHYSEMFMILPADWPLDKMQEEESAYWPAFILKTFARLPNFNRLTLSPFMTIPYQDGGTAPGSPFDSFMVLDGRELGDGFGLIAVDEGRSIMPYLVVPLKESETEYKISQMNADGLWVEFKNRGADVSKLFVVDLERPSLI